MPRDRTLRSTSGDPEEARCLHLNQIRETLMKSFHRERSPPQTESAQTYKHRSHTIPQGQSPMCVVVVSCEVRQECSPVAVRVPC